MAEKMGGKLIYGLGVFLTAVLTVISPFAAYWGLIPFLVVRVAEGFTEVNYRYSSLSETYTIIADISSILYVYVGCNIPCNAQYASALGTSVREK